jgi:hypothetical protein
MSQRIYVQLGRYGDILNILPLVKEYRDKTGQKPAVMVAEAYADLLDGVTYCDKIVFRGDFTNLSRAQFEAYRRSKDVVIAQVYGDMCIQPHEAENFAVESWIKAGADCQWNNLSREIDARNHQREAELIDRVITRDAPFILVALKGISSPFPCWKAVKEEIERQLSEDFQIIDLSKVRAERFCDILGLIDRAHCLVTVDTGILHLSRASKTPVVALITRSPDEWHGTPWFPQQIGRFYYDEMPVHMPALVERIYHARKPQPVVHHVFPVNPSGELTQREAISRQSWKESTPSWHGVPCSSDQILSIIKTAEITAGSGDIIALTNSDVCFAPGLDGKVLEVCSRYGAAFTHRRDFMRIKEPFIFAEPVKAGKWYRGSDAFFFTKAWWLEHGHELPDFVIGREKWDEVFRQLIKYHGGTEIKDMIYHEVHQTTWDQPENFNDPGNVHNRKLAAEWQAKMGLQPDDWLWWASRP